MGAVVSRKFGLGGKRRVFGEVSAALPESTWMSRFIALPRSTGQEVSAALPESTELSCPEIWEQLE